MRYFAFEAGSRAGMSAERFFKAYCENCKTDDELFLVDIDPVFVQLPCSENVHRLLEQSAMSMITKGDIVFPCDELTRQNNEYVRSISANNVFSVTSADYYNKRAMNKMLSNIAKGIKIPKTFSCDDLFIKPNTLSAGSKGCYPANNVCVSERINICHEYVIDCEKKVESLRIFPREVKLKNGYDKYIKLLSPFGELAEKVKEFIDSTNQLVVFDGVFHLQIAENEKGELYYIESSKRISGSSIVNISRGFNPFCFMNDVSEPTEDKYSEDVWYRFEDFLV